MQKWKSGKVEKRKSGRVEKRKSGKVEEWKMGNGEIQKEKSMQKKEKYIFMQLFI